MVAPPLIDPMADRPRGWRNALLLVLLPILVKLPLLVGLLVVDPAKRYTGLAVAGDHGWWSGGATIDPNIAYTSHALGSYAARQLLAGHIPWWNPYEGVGAPLAGEMQAAALFPLTLLLALPNGQLIFHLTLQIIAGLATYGLLREMRIGRSAALAAAVLFEFNGMFAWLANAVVNPIPFLPLMLWGIERVRRPDGTGRLAGTSMIAGGLAASLYAGFPEVAYLNALFVLCWASVRLWSAGHGRTALLWGIALPTLAGLLIAAPIVVAFIGYLPHAQIGLHDNGAGHYTYLPPAYLPMIAIPYFMGGIFVDRPDFWGSVGGYAGLLPLALAGAGLVGRRQRALRWTIAGWIVAALALTYGAAWLFFVMKIIPGFKEAAIYRYLPASWLMGLSVLAAFGLDDIGRSRTRPLAVATGAIAVTVIALCVLTRAVIGHLPHDPFAWMACFVQLLLLAGFIRSVLSGTADRSTRARTAATLVAVEAVFLFLLPVLAHPRRIEVAEGGVAFLQNHLGQQRFVTFGPIAPNYGSYYGIAQVNHNDLPVPAAWTDFVQRRLDPGMDPILFLRPSSIATFANHRANYAAIGVRYVVTHADTPLPALPVVYADRLMTIHRLPDTRPYWSAPGCRIVTTARTEAVATCGRPSRLTRLELLMPGWTATVNGVANPVSLTDEIFQSVPLPAGRAVISFDYAPPHIGAAAIAALAGSMLLLAHLIAIARSRKQTASA